jgi:phage gp29-like protein
MAQLLDQFGKPIPPAAFASRVSDPTMLADRPAVANTSIRALDPATLGEALRAADQGESLLWMEIAEEIERRDGHYLGVLSTRKSTVANLPITVTPASDKPAHKRHAAFVQDWVDRGILEVAAFDMLDAIGKGRSTHEIVWHAEAGNYWPQQLLFRPARWFEVSAQDGNTILMRNTDTIGAPPSAPDGTRQIGFSPLEPHRFVNHVHPLWSGLTMHAGLSRLAVWYVMFKLFTVRDWGIFVQNYGLPIRLGRYGPDASDQDRNVLWRAVCDFAGSLGIMVPKGMDFEFVEPKNGAGSNDVHQRRVEFCNSELSKAVLGQTGTTDSKQGAHASGAIHRMVQEDIERLDARLLSVTATRQLAIPMVSFTFGPQDKYPFIRFGRPDEVPLEELVKLIQFAGPQGLKFRAQDFYDRTGLKAPQESDDVFGLVAQAQPIQPAHVLPAQDRPAQDMPPKAPPPTTTSPQAEDQQEITLHSRVGRLLSRHVQANGPNIIHLMTQALARDAEAGMARMTEAVRSAVENADSMDALEQQLKGMKLPTEQFQQAMQTALMVSELAGEAMVLEEMARDG